MIDLKLWQFYLQNAYFQGYSYFNSDHCYALMGICIYANKKRVLSDLVTSTFETLGSCLRDPGCRGAENFAVFLI